MFLRFKDSGVDLRGKNTCSAELTMGVSWSAAGHGIFKREEKLR
jgi:hypothetical protein